MKSTFHSAVAILKLFNGRSEVSVTEAHRVLKLPKSTASRQLQEMANAGFLEKDRTSRKYRLGPVFMDARQSHANSTSLIDEASRELKELRDRFGHTCFVVGRSGASLVLLNTLEGTGPIRIHATPHLIGGVAFYRSPGYAMLSRLTDDELREIFPTMLRSLTMRGVSGFDEFLARIKIVRNLKYAEVPDGGFPGVGGLSVAVVPASGNAVAINIAYVDRITSTNEKLSMATALVEAGRRLGQRFGDPYWAEEPATLGIREKSSK